MKRIVMIAVAVLAMAGAVIADMDDKLFNLTAVGALTNSSGVVLRGSLEAVAVDVTAPATSTVTVVSEDGRTLFTKAGIAADATYLVRAASHTTAGALATFNSNWSTNAGVTSTEAQTWYVAQPMAGKVTVTLVGQNAASVTNNTKVTLIYSR